MSDTDGVPRPAAGVVLPRQPKQERSRRKQAQLLDAAESLFASRGYDSVTVDEIAAGAGYASATFYNYFADKTQAFILVADRHFPAVVPVLRPVLDALRDGTSLRDAIRQSASTLVENRQEVPWLRKDWRALALTDPQVRSYQQTLDRLWDRDLVALLSGAAEQGLMSVGDPELMAAILRVAVDSVVDAIVIDGLDPDPMLDTLAQLLTDGLLPHAV